MYMFIHIYFAFVLQMTICHEEDFRSPLTNAIPYLTHLYPEPLTQRALAKEAPLTCGKKHKERLSYVTGQLEKLNNLLQIMPGIIAPKFPVSTTIGHRSVRRGSQSSLCACAFLCP